ncbi:hypothetical protein [Paenibacillus sedimenti]|uniref:Uncharacterized protein n=1 Tax=Paenibacillus sedimenti TaxID=2770274 RepID=A0A926QLU2_9BACL|nr:hypothetical protein [Paenibacillus sedimenti]MBD0382947.1 hypothetical protein [Paenibacillus sedimenti]
MSKQEYTAPGYFDGSVNIEFAEELIEGAKVESNAEPSDNEEWRRFVGGNPFGA